MCLLLQISSRNSLFEMLPWIHFFFQFTYNFTLLFILFLFTSVILVVVKIGGPWTRSIFWWTRSTEGVHGPGVHVLYFPSPSWDMQTFYTNDQQYSGIFWTQDASSATDCIDSLLSSIESRVHDIYSIYRGYYTVARRYEFYVRVARTISHEWAQRTSEILFLPREHKIHIFELTCNVLFII